MPTEVTIDRYAEIRAEMESGVLRDEALARAGLSADAWTEAQRSWLEGMGAEIARGRFELTQRYSQAFLARQRALTASAPAMSASAMSASAMSAPVEIAVARPVEVKPTFLAADARRGGAEPVSGAAADPPAASMPVVPSVRAPNPLLSGTMSVDASAFRPSLPFDPAAQPQVTAQATPATELPKVKRPPAELSGTSMAFTAPVGPALPFANKPPSSAESPSAPPPPPAPPAPAAPAAAAPAVSLPAVQRAPAALSGTSMAISPVKGPALPFAPGAAPPAPKTEMPKVQRPPAALSGTSMAMELPKGPAMPFAPTAPAAATAPAKESAVTPASDAGAPQEPPGPHGLSLEHYASLCVELSADPARAGETFARYRITAEQGAAVDGHWKRRISEDPRLRAAFDRAYSAYQSWFHSARGR